MHRAVLVTAAAAAITAADRDNREQGDTADQRHTSDAWLLPGQYISVETTAVYSDQANGGSGRLYWPETQNRSLYVPADRKTRGS